MVQTGVDLLQDGVVLGNVHDLHLVALTVELDSKSITDSYAVLSTTLRNERVLRSTADRLR
jgi:hypothetical protein